MGREDWYRNRVWDAETEAAFRDRLKRSRSLFSKVQYIRIQAAYLLASDDPSVRKAGLDLMYEFLNDYPDTEDTLSDKILAFTLLGDFFFERREWDRAFVHYNKALDLPLSLNQCRHGTIIGYVKSAVKTSRAGEYDNCALLLGKLEPVFLAEYFEAGLAGAMLNDARGDHDAARECASVALRTLGMTSPFRRSDKVLGNASAVATEEDIRFLESILSA